MIWHDYPDRDLMALDLADTLASSISSALRHEDRVTLAVPGGTSPGPMFDALSSVHMDWDRVDILLTDERWVPETSPRSNTALLRNRLLTGHAAAASLVPLYAEAETPEEKLDELIEALKPKLPIDVLVLGMGADMHTASLFPGADRLEEALSNHAPALLPMRAPGAPEPRVTLTAPVLKGAIDTHILIMGTEKKDAIQKAARMKPIDAPVSVLLDGAHIHYCD
ncbi:6-phosphogluconolactonase [Pseudooceanicola sp. C21-150M6]|uniref:6-phosphogluconolactonase n=1 Tax=Pseudooceanicola sp. C21-150M6 TaxID=3434355 RepID=UPI003D7FB484